MNKQQEGLASAEGGATGCIKDYSCVLQAILSNESCVQICRNLSAAAQAAVTIIYLIPFFDSDIPLRQRPSTRRLYETSHHRTPNCPKPYQHVSSVNTLVVKPRTTAETKWYMSLLLAAHTAQKVLTGMKQWEPRIHSGTPVSELIGCPYLIRLTGDTVGPGGNSASALRRDFEG